MDGTHFDSLIKRLSRTRLSRAQALQGVAAATRTRRRAPQSLAAGR